MSLSLEEKYAIRGVGVFAAYILVGTIMIGSVIALRFQFKAWALPRVFWSQDVCPEPHITCGVLPLYIVIGCVAWAIILAGASKLYTRVTD